MKGKKKLMNTIKEQILEEFIEICKTGTSKDCRIFVEQAKKQGISYEELCEYKRQKQQ